MPVTSDAFKKKKYMSILKYVHMYIILLQEASCKIKWKPGQVVVDLRIENSVQNL